MQVCVYAGVCIYVCIQVSVCAHEHLLRSLLPHIPFEKVSLCSHGCPRTFCLGQASLKLKALPAPISLGLLLRASITISSFFFFF